MQELSTIRCVACEGGVPPLTKDEIQDLLKKVNHWSVSSDNKIINQRFSFKNFHQVMAFVNAIAWISHIENHHPDLELGYNYCQVNYTTHAINGLSKNDFICAAKIDALQAQYLP